MRRSHYPFIALLAVVSANAIGADFRVITDNGVVMYDAPSTRAKKLFVATRNYPVEIISTDGTWVKVRDVAGDLAWVERRQLVERKTVIVNVPVLDVRQKADEQSPSVFQVAQGVTLDIDPEQGPPGWLRVRHRDGSSGYVRINQVWGL